MWQTDKMGNVIPWYDSNEMEKWEKEWKLPLLTGTQRQVVWARDIRNKYLNDLFKRFDLIPKEYIPVFNELRSEANAGIRISRATRERTNRESCAMENTQSSNERNSQVMETSSGV